MEDQPFEISDRGVYISLLEDHPGSVKFPVPLIGAHYKAWRKAEQESKDKKEDTVFAEWRRALALIEDWSIEGVPTSALTPEGDQVPLEVIHWVRLVSMLYMLDAVSLKNLRAPSATT